MAQIQTYPALTNATIATGDQLLINDASGPNSTKNMTFLELDKRYVVTVGDSDIAGNVQVTSAVYPPVRAIRTSTQTATALGGLDIQHESNGDVTAGFGAGLSFSITDTGVSDAILAQITGVRGTADTEGELVFFAGTNGAEEFLRIGQTGKLATGGEASPDCESGGFTLKMSATSGKLLTLKSTNVSHALTSIVETDTFGTFAPTWGVGGGLNITAITDGSEATGEGALYLNAILRATADTTTTTAGRGVFDIVSTQHDGANTISSVADDGTSVAFINNTLATHLFKGSGNSWMKSVQLYGDTAGIASTTTYTGVTDTPTTDPGWTSSSTLDMNAPDGYAKAYVGTQAVVIPYWNT